MRGLVLDDLGRPVPGANVRLLSPSGPEEIAVQESSEVGAFAFLDLAPGGLRVYVHTGRHQPYTSEVFTLASGEDRQLRIVLEPGRTISGQVLTPEGLPIAGASVGSSDDGSRVVLSDAQGRFELEGLGSLPVTLYAVAPRLAPAWRPDVLPGARAVRIALERPASIEGSVVTGSGLDPVRVDLCFRDRREADGLEPLCVARALVDPAVTSAFVLAGLPPGRYDLVLSPRHGDAVRIPAELAAGAHIELGPVRVSR